MLPAPLFVVGRCCYFLSPDSILIGLEAHSFSITLWPNSKRMTSTKSGEDYYCVIAIFVFFSRKYYYFLARSIADGFVT